MKKKIVAVLMTVTACMVCLAGCNRQVVDTKYKFDKALVKVGEEWITVDVKKWGDYEGEQIQLVLEDGTVMIVSYVNCILYKGTLPKGGQNG